MNTNGDRFFRLKYMAFCMSQMPPEGVETDYDDFVRYAKFQLCVDKGVLMEDPLWNIYTDEMVLVEYFANLFAKSKDERERFEAQLIGDDPDLNSWFDKKIAENKKELEAQAAKYEDQVKFTPDTLGE